MCYIGRAFWEVSPAAEGTRQKSETREKSGGNTPLREERDIWSLDPQGMDGQARFSGSWSKQALLYASNKLIRVPGNIDICGMWKSSSTMASFCKLPCSN